MINGECVIQKKYENLLEIIEEIIEKNATGNLGNTEKKNPKYSNEYRKRREAYDPLFKFSNSIRGLISTAFTIRGKTSKKGSKTEQILGCTISEFAKYIEDQFKPGMRFENHGEWHLDHIKPMASAKTYEDVVSLNHYTNFQPLWKEENLSKGAKYNGVDYQIYS